MATFALDPFTDVAGTALPSHTAGVTGGPWVRHASGAATNAVISGSGTRLRASTASSIHLNYITAVPITAEYDVECDFVCMSTAVEDYTGICGRINTAANTFYYVNYATTTGSWSLNRMVTGTSTSLGTFSSAMTAAQTVHVKLQIRDAAKKVFLDGVERISSADNTITAAGNAGLRIYTTTVGDSTSIHLDNFSATDAAVSSGTGQQNLLLMGVG